MSAAVCLALAAAALAAALLIILYDRRKTRRTMETMDSMLNAAIKGEFLEECYDESLLSSVEAKLARYLSASEINANRLNEEKDKIKELIGDISHQTKTPLANILLYSQLLSEQELPPQARGCAEPLGAQAEKLRFLIDALVKTSRLETGVLSLRPERSSVEQLIEAAIEQVRPMAEKKGVSLDAEPGDCYALFDRKWTAEALYNLLDNAIKYTPSGGRVTVSASPYNLFCRISVRDTGIGIPLSEQSAVFSRFYRSPQVAQEPGVGIGLYLTRQIAAAEDGYVKLSSQPGQGSDFSLFLPSCN